LKEEEEEKKKPKPEKKEFYLTTRKIKIGNPKIETIGSSIRPKYITISKHFYFPFDM